MVGMRLGRLPDGRVVFVPYVIPGELVRLRVVEDKPHQATAELVEVLEPSPDRVIPRCAHFSTCGGCHYQQMNYPAQLKAKADILREQLERIGGLRGIPDIEMHASPERVVLPQYNPIPRHRRRQVGISNSAYQPTLCDP